MRTFATLGVIVLAGATLAAPPPDAANRGWCRLVLHQERVLRDDLELSVDLARSEQEAAEQIFELIDSLFKNDAIERITFLAAKHDQDAAQLEVKRRRLQIEHQEAVIAQYNHLCKSPDDQGAVDRSYRDYDKLQCDLFESAAAIAEVDLVYLREVLASVRDLRENDVATRQDVIFAERNLKMAGKRLTQAKRRLAGCRKE